MKALKRDTTIAKCFPVAASSPEVTSPENWAGFASRPLFLFFSVTLCLRGASLLSARSAQIRGEDFNVL